MASWLIAWVWQWGSGRRPRDIEGVLPAPLFERLLRRERLLADRTDSCFSLLLYRPQQPLTRKMAAGLVRILRRRLRWTDELGWMEKDCLGVLLPHTPAQGAWVVVEAIARNYGNVSAPFSVSVYTYPSHRTGSRAAEARPDAAAPERAVQPMEPLFARRLPAWKRGLDLVGATAGLLFLSPLLLAVGLAIKLTSRGPVVFTQVRSGLGGKPFRMLKFRTMVQDAEARKAVLLARNEQDGPVFKIRNDPRVTPVGRVLRATSIDELPQLWNVWLGQMSLVGPRPLPCHEAEQYRGWQRQRFDVLPGLTCIWQVYGRCRVSFLEWARMDARYVHARSLGRDLMLLLKTIPAVLSGRGAC